MPISMDSFANSDSASSQTEPSSPHFTAPSRSGPEGMPSVYTTLPAQLTMSSNDIP
jgi:hypothetical protein